MHDTQCGLGIDLARSLPDTGTCSTPTARRTWVLVILDRLGRLALQPRSVTAMSVVSLSGAPEEKIPWSMTALTTPLHLSVHTPPSSVPANWAGTGSRIIPRRMDARCVWRYGTNKSMLAVPPASSAAAHFYASILSYGVCVEQDTYCPGGRSQYACPAHSSSPDEASYCTCDSSYYGVTHDDCKLCDANFYCPGGDPLGQQQYACTPNSNSPPGSDDGTDCQCDSSYYEPVPATDASQGPDCVLCPASTYCPGGKRCVPLL